MHENTREGMARLLNAHLAAAQDLFTQCKQAHWNVKGPHFYSLHLLFDKLAEDAEGQADELAERCAALGGTAHGTAHEAAKNTYLAPYPLDLSDGMGHVAALADAQAAYGRALRSAIEKANAAGDADTADLFTQLSREADKGLWMLEAHLQARR
jgi:starvation-inducible DNA-binding protein